MDDPLNMMATLLYFSATCCQHQSFHQQPQCSRKCQTFYSIISQKNKKSCLTFLLLYEGDQLMFYGPLLEKSFLATRETHQKIGTFSNELLQRLFGGNF